MKFPFEEWTDREKGLKRQNEKEGGVGGWGGREQLGASWRKGEWGAVCVRERAIWGAGGQAMGVQLKVHTLAKIWVLSRQSSRGPLLGTHHTKAACLKMWRAPLTGGLEQSRRYCSPLLGLSEPPAFLIFSFLSSLLDSLLTSWRHWQVLRLLGHFRPSPAKSDGMTWSEDCSGSFSTDGCTDLCYTSISLI